MFAPITLSARSATLITALLAVTACAPVTDEATPDTEMGAETSQIADGQAVSLGRIREEGDFLALVAGRQLVGKNGSLTVNADGTYSGQEAGLPVSGTWNWRTPTWCATPDQDETACYTWDRIPAGIRQIRQQGMGGGVDYVIR